MKRGKMLYRLPDARKVVDADIADPRAVRADIHKNQRDTHFGDCVDGLGMSDDESCGNHFRLFASGWRGPRPGLFARGCQSDERVADGKTDSSESDLVGDTQVILRPAHDVLNHRFMPGFLPVSTGLFFTPQSPPLSET